MKASEMIIKLENEDLEQIQEHQLKVIAEEGMRQESDDGDEDEEDPDADLDFWTLKLIKFTLNKKDGF